MLIRTNYIRQKNDAQEKLLEAEKKVNLNRNCLEEAKSLLEQSDKMRRVLEQEFEDVNEVLGEQTCHNQSLVSSIKKGQEEMSTLNVS